MSAQDEDRLRRVLHAQAGRAETGEVDLESVTSRARRIRRRRTTLAALSTAAVLGLVVPAGLAITGPAGDSDAPPVAGQSPDVPERLLEVSLLDDATPGGEPPSLAYLRDGRIVSPAGDTAVPGNGTPVALTVFGERWLVLMDTGDGRYTLDTVDASGRQVGMTSAQAAPVLSDDGTIAAYVSRSGHVHAMDTEGHGVVLDPAGEVGADPQVAAVLGSGDCHGSAGCAVVVNTSQGGAAALRPERPAEPVRGFRSVADASPSLVLGTVSVSDDGSCSALHDDAGAVWKTCDNSFGKMSPDERYAIGYPAYLSGMGPKSVSIVDMAGGRELVRFADEGRTDTHVRQVVWESDTSVLMTVWDGEDRSWSILRGGIDGSLSEVETGLGGDAMDPSVHLPRR